MTKSEKDYQSKKKAKNYLENLQLKFEFCPGSHFLNGYVGYELKYRKIVPCGKEWCEVCGEVGSLLHRQRMARGMDKILSCNVVGYWVFTFPVEIRESFKNQVLLNDFMNFIREFLKQYDFVIGGVSRWHWGGDKKKGFNPHLNVLVNQKIGLLPIEVIEEVKKAVKVWIEEKIGEVKDIVIDYSYVKDLLKIVHRWRYICRPTMLLIKDDFEIQKLSFELWNFRNIRWWGHWKKKESKNEAIKVLNDENIRWSFAGKFQDVLEESFEWKYLGYGIFKNDFG